MRILSTLAVLVIMFFLVAAFSNAQPIEVINTNDDGAGSLRQAIIDANANPGPDEIVFMEELSGTILISNANGEMAITDDLTIIGPPLDANGMPQITIDADITGANDSRIFNIDNGDADNEIVVSISGLMLINGFAPGVFPAGVGGAIFNSEDLSIDSCVFDGNRADIGGGAIFNEIASTITIISNSIFRSNITIFDGGAIFNGFNGLIAGITNTTFHNNTAVRSGGAIFHVGTISLMTNSSFINNTADSGGAIAIFDGSAITEINNTTFSSNNAPSGGAIANNGGTINILANSAFSSNTADSGGAISNAFGSITEINNTIFNNNSAFDGSGGAIFNVGIAGITAIANSTFNGNSASQTGGAIVNLGGTITVIANSTFSKNRATRDGGAIDNSSDASIDEISYSTFSDNMAGDGGGAINISFGSTITKINNCTFDGNSAVFGGAISNDQSVVNISFTTIANNEAEQDGGISHVGAATTNIRNSVVAFNIATVLNTTNNCNAVLGGMNNYSNDATCGFGLGFDDTNIILGTLTDNGGPTQTLALLGGDPLDGATDDCEPLNSAGMPLANDQRFFPRPFGSKCDSGAFEGGPSASVTITKISDPPGGEGFEFATTGFDDLFDCELQGEFMLDHGDIKSCAVPPGNYSITEDIPEGQALNIFCSELPPGATTNDDLGELSFSVITAENNVNCLFINVLIGTLINIEDEPEGANCEEGGVRIDTGLDLNLNGVLDPDEVENTFFVCNGEPVVQGPQGPPGSTSLINLESEPPGPNCEFGGIKIETGIDINDNGSLEPNEVQETAFVCNGPPGTDGPTDPEEPEEPQDPQDPVEPPEEELMIEVETPEITAEPRSTISIPVTINNPVTPETSLFLETRQTVIGATFTVDIPDGFNIEELVSTKGLCSIELGECEIGDITPGETVTVVLDTTLSDIVGVFNVSFMVTTASGQTFSGSAIVRVEGDEITIEATDGEGGCAIAGPNTSPTSLLGLLLYALIPAAIMFRRRFRKSGF